MTLLHASSHIKLLVKALRRSATSFYGLDLVLTSAAIFPELCVYPNSTSLPFWQQIPQFVNVIERVATDSKLYKTLPSTGKTCVKSRIVIQ